LKAFRDIGTFDGFSDSRIHKKECRASRPFTHQIFIYAQQRLTLTYTSTYCDPIFSFQNVNQNAMKTFHPRKKGGHELFSQTKFRRLLSGLAGLLALAVPLIIALQQKQGLPRVWTAEALKDWELPLANPAYSQEPVTEQFYYNLPVRTIFKTYPVYHPDYEPRGYQDWLRQQEPEVVFDPSQLKTEEDWIKAGEILFDYPFDTLNAIISAENVRDREFYSYSEIPLTKEGIMPYARWIVSEKGRVLLGNLSCAMCHTRVQPDGTVLKGAQGNFPGDMAFAYSIRNASEKDVREITSALFASPWTEGDPHGALVSKKKEEILEAYRAVPKGAFGRQGTSILFPPQVPDLIGVKDHKFLDHGGLGQHRGPEDMMRYIAMNQTMDVLNFYGDFQPLGLTREQIYGKEPILFSGTHDRHSEEQMLAMTRFLYSLRPPENPNKPTPLSERGKTLFAEQGCVTCHTPPLFTNNKLTPADGFTIPEAHYDKYDIFDVSVGTDPSYTLKTRRGTGYYKVPSLRGLWYRGPFFHDASLANLNDVLDPARLNPDYIPTAFKGAGVKNRAVPGHEFGMELGAEDRKALIAYLMTL
jgi:hypothetical protein